MDINNLDEYVSLVVDAIVRTGIRRQMEAFRSGFNQVLSYSANVYICGNLFPIRVVIDA